MGREAHTNEQEISTRRPFNELLALAAVPLIYLNDHDLYSYLDPVLAASISGVAPLSEDLALTIRKRFVDSWPLLA